jgi:hypothetical protein
MAGGFWFAQTRRGKTSIRSPALIRSGFGRKPKPEEERNKGDGADASEPQQDKPQQAL